jgi:hypothetical protein
MFIDLIATLEQLKMNLGRTVSHDKILRVAILIGGKTGFN